MEKIKLCKNRYRKDGVEYTNYIIYKFVKMTTIGAMWDIVEKGTLEEMRASWESSKYNNFNKTIEI
jgi:hypothetical protein